MTDRLLLDTSRRLSSGQPLLSGATVCFKSTGMNVGQTMYMSLFCSCLCCFLTLKKRTKAEVAAEW